MNGENLARKENIIFFDSFKNDNDYCESELYRCIKQEMRKEALLHADKLLEKNIHELEEECMNKEIKLKNSVPMSMIWLLIFTVSIVVFCFTAIFFQIFTATKVIHYYILLFWLVAGIGLCRTSLKTLSEWKRFLTDEKK